MNRRGPDTRIRVHSVRHDPRTGRTRVLVYLCAEAIAGRDAWEDETCTRYAVDHKIAYECGPGRTPVVAIHPTTGERMPVDENLNAAANATTPLRATGHELPRIVRRAWDRKTGSAVAQRPGARTISSLGHGRRRPRR